jgi:hypothetical protein
MNYPNLYFSIKSTHEYIEPYMAEHMSNSIAGFTTSLKTRPLIIAKMEEFIRNNLINIYSIRMYNEMKTFVWTNGKPQAMKSYHDDLIMACAIGCWVRDTALITNQRNTEYNRAFLDCMFKSEKELRTTIPGMRGHKIIEDDDQMKKQEEFLWVLKG